MTCQLAISWRKMFVYIVVFLIVSNISNLAQGGEVETRLTRAELTPARLNVIGTFIRASIDATLAGKATPPPADATLSAATNGVHIALVRNGKVLGEAIAEHTTLLGNIRVATGQSLGTLTATKVHPCTILVSIFLKSKPLKRPAVVAVRLLSNIGLEGFHATYRGNTATLAPLQPILRSQNWQKALLTLAQQVSPSPPDTGLTDKREYKRLLQLITRKEFKVEIIPAVTLVQLAGQKKFVPVYRLGRVVDITEVTAKNIRAAITRAERWYAINQKENGRFPYYYDPIRNEDTDRRKLVMIRRAMNVATVGKLWRFTKNTGTQGIGRKALRALLDDYYLEDPQGKFGYLREGEGDADLGSAAGALWAIVTLDAHKDKNPALRKTAEQLRDFILSMRKTNGRYKTHYQQEIEPSAENYYPGEAQVALMAWAQSVNDPAIVRLCFESYQYYRRHYSAWEKKYHHPPYAFIPWHTQANRRIYRVKKRKEIADFIFTTNRVLTTAQQIYSVPGIPLPADCRGRFYTIPKRVQGLPHVSSTGVYMEGMVEAFALARELGETEYAKLFRKSVLWGARDLLQLQIKDRLDTILMPNPQRALGGFRVRMSDARIRIDSMQHATSALIKVAQTLTPADYAVTRTLTPPAKRK